MIAAQVPGLEESIRPRVTGLLVPSDSTAALAEALATTHLAVGAEGGSGVKAAPPSFGSPSPRGGHYPPLDPPAPRRVAVGAKIDRGKVATRRAVIPLGR
mgnify:CR=1 FL=1